MVRSVAVLAALCLLASSCGSEGGEAPSATCNAAPVTTPVPDGYGGLLFDTHVHLDDPAVVPPLACSMEREEVEVGVALTPMDPAEPLVTQDRYLTATAGHESRFVAGFHVDPTTPAEAAADRVEAVLNEAGLLFVAVGEADFAEPPWRGTSLTADPWPDRFALAEERDLFLVIEPVAGQAAELRSMLERHPDTKVLVTGGAVRRDLPDLLRDHDNLFAAITAPALMPLDASGREQFVERFDARWPALLDDAVDRWLPVVQAGPRRVMWGSDVTAPWQADAAVYARYARFTRTFLDRLPRPLQGPVALTNARRLFGVPTPPQPDA